jgi:hypothetical protein
MYRATLVSWTNSESRGVGCILYPIDGTYIGLLNKMIVNYLFYFLCRKYSEKDKQNGASSAAGMVGLFQAFNVISLAA